MKKGFLGRVLPKGWGRKKGAPKGNSRAAGRKQGRAFSTRFDREVDAPPPMNLCAKKEYLCANCLVLAAAVFAKPWAKAGAEELLPTARMLDAARMAK